MLPVFTQSHFLTQSRSPLPLDWIAYREMGRAGEQKVLEQISRFKPYLIVDKAALPAIATDKELQLVKSLIQQGRVVEETPWFQVRLPE